MNRLYSPKGYIMIDREDEQDELLLLEAEERDIHFTVQDFSNLIDSKGFMFALRKLQEYQPDNKSLKIAIDSVQAELEHQMSRLE